MRVFISFVRSLCVHLYLALVRSTYVLLSWLRSFSQSLYCSFVHSVCVISLCSSFVISVCRSFCFHFIRLYWCCYFIRSSFLYLFSSL